MNEQSVNSHGQGDEISIYFNDFQIVRHIFGLIVFSTHNNNIFLHPKNCFYSKCKDIVQLTTTRTLDKL